MKGVPDNAAARRVKFRNMLYQCGFDCFCAVGYVGQDLVVVRHQRGEADKKLLDMALRELVAGMDAELEGEEYHDSEGY